MEAFEMSLMAQVSACQARIAAMQAANQQRAVLGQSVAYDEAEFMYEAREIERLAEALRARAS